MLLVEHLELTDLAGIQFFDKTSSRWITHLRNSPPIKLNTGAVLHMKARETEVKPQELVFGSKDAEMNHANIKKEGSPLKRKSTYEADTDVVDLTCLSDNPTPSEKRHRTKRAEPSSPLADRSSGSKTAAVGLTPAKLTKFPPARVGDMDIRMKWIEDNQSMGSLEKRFGVVFGGSYSSSTFHRHQAEWRNLRERGLLPSFQHSDSTWSSFRKLVKQDSDGISLGTLDGGEAGSKTASVGDKCTTSSGNSDSDNGFDQKGNGRTNRIVSPEL